MKKINVVIIDDEEDAVNLIKHYTSKINEIKTAACFTDAISALKYCNEIKNDIQIIFLDINMPEMNGLEFIEKLTNKDIEVVITTAHEKYALIGYEFSVLDYLLKPFTFNRIYSAVEKYFKKYKDIEVDTIKIKTTTGFEKMVINKIVYIESYQNYVKIHRTDGSISVCRATIKSFDSLLNEKNFIRVSKGYILSKMYISKFTDTVIILDINGEEKELNYSKKYLGDSNILCPPNQPHLF